MRNLKFVWVAGATLLAATLALANDPAPLDDEANEAINKIADLIEKGDMDAAKKAAKDLSASKLDAVMHGFKTRKTKGIGVGPTPGAIVPDGIEQKINAIVRDGMTANAAKKESDALARAGYVSAAIALVAVAKTPEKDDGKKKKADWVEWSDAMVKSSQEFATASKGGEAAAIKKAAGKLKQTCDSCHMVFKNN
jgi:hypothetical protein